MENLLLLGVPILMHIMVLFFFTSMHISQLTVFKGSFVLSRNIDYSFKESNREKNQLQAVSIPQAPFWLVKREKLFRLDLDF